MVENSLNKIIKKKEQKLNELKRMTSLDSLKEKIKENNTFINFKEKIENNIANNKISLIAEIKKASPSAGIIVQDYNPVDIAKKYYENKATCLSVLTEEDFFQGNLIHLHKIKQKINLPILCKDFFIDPFQVYLAKSYGADAILIILAGVTEKIELLSKFFKSDSPIKKVLIFVFLLISKSSSFVLIPLSEINGPLWFIKIS